MWAEIVLAILLIVAGLVCAIGTILALWADALEQAATGSHRGGHVWLILSILAFAGVGGGIAILVL